MSFTTDIPAFGSAWGQPFLIGPGTIHVAHTSEERIPKRQLIEAIDLYKSLGPKTLHMRPIDVGILGATGMVGQHFIRFLQGHPWFKLTWLGASDRSAGKKLKDATAWRLDGDMPASPAEIVVSDSKPGHAPRLVFSAMDASVATEIERAFAHAGHIVVSNSRNHRMDPDVPLLVPEINPGHLSLIHSQQKNRAWPGMIVTNPNCSTVVLTMALAPLLGFGIERVIAMTMQAVSGAGYPGVASMDIVANVIPFIGAEEEKMQQETQKILGSVSEGQAVPLKARVSAHCHRVAVTDGHTVALSVGLVFEASDCRTSSKLSIVSTVSRRIEIFPALPQSPSSICRSRTGLSLAVMLRGKMA